MILELSSSVILAVRYKQYRKTFWLCVICLSRSRKLPRLSILNLKKRCLKSFWTNFLSLKLSTIFTVAIFLVCFLISFNKVRYKVLSLLKNRLRVSKGKIFSIRSKSLLINANLYFIGCRKTSIVFNFSI